MKAGKSIDINDTIKTVPFLKRLNISKVCSLTPDASHRRYYRLFIDGGETAVVMCSQEENISPFLNIQKFLANNKIPVPEIYCYEENSGTALIEDLGDTSLESSLKEKNVTDAKRLYMEALELCLDFQALCVQKESCIAFTREFDFEKFMWEFDFFLNHMIEGLRKKELLKSDREKLRALFSEIIEPLLLEPRIFTHRDFHSRNLMIKNDKIRIIDFQDARLGLCQYDLVSLLRDSYVVLDEDWLEEFLDFYLLNRGKTAYPVKDRKKFRKIFDLMSIQRNLKAVGTFSYQVVVMKNSRYEQWIEPTLRYVRNNLIKYRELAGFAKLLGKYAEEILP